MVFSLLSDKLLRRPYVLRRGESVSSDAKASEPNPAYCVFRFLRARVRAPPGSRSLRSESDSEDDELVSTRGWEVRAVSEVVR